MAALRIRPAVAYWRRGKFFSGVKPHEIFSFCSALSLLLECGLPLVKALNILASRVDNRTLARSAADMAKTVEEGRSFSDAASQHAPYLPGQFIAMLRAGEKTGKLGEMLARIADSGERVLQSRRKLITMFIYPAIVVIVAISRRRGRFRRALQGIRLLHEDGREDSVDDEHAAQGRRRAAQSRISGSGSSLWSSACRSST